MCSPVVLAGVQMATEAMSISAQNQMTAANASAQGAYAVEVAKSSYSALNDRAAEENLSIAVDKSRRKAQGLRERGTVAARASESGLAGNVAVRDMISSLVWEAQDLGALEAQREVTGRQIERQKVAAFTEGLSGINRAKAIQKQGTVSPISAALRIAGAGLEGYSRYEMLRAPTRPRGAKAGTPDYSLTEYETDGNLLV